MKVFLSSTAVDLVAYRQVADDTILRLTQQAVAMERFGPLPGTPVEECERLARESEEQFVSLSRLRVKQDPRDDVTSTPLRWRNIHTSRAYEAARLRRQRARARPA
jgi:hypothetical protein